MQVLAFSAAYLACCLLVFPVQQSILMSVLVAASLSGVVWLTRENSLVRSFLWFRKYVLRGLFVIAVTLAAVSALFVYDIGTVAQNVLEVILFFVWFWLFGVLGSRPARHSNL